MGLQSYEVCVCVCVSEKQRWEEAEIDKMIIGPSHTEGRARALKHPHLNAPGSFQQEGQDVQEPVHDLSSTHPKYSPFIPNTNVCASC